MGFTERRLTAEDLAKLPTLLIRFGPRPTQATRPSEQPPKPFADTADDDDGGPA
jgi:hypothetical protein